MRAKIESMLYKIEVSPDATLEEKIDAIEKLLLEVFDYIDESVQDHNLRKVHYLTAFNSFSNLMLRTCAASNYSDFLDQDNVNKIADVLEKRLTKTDDN